MGCFFGSILAAIFGERLGRRWTIGHGCWIMIVGAVLQAASYGRAQLIVGRIVSGIGLGIINSTVPVLQAEFSPKATRGICKSRSRGACILAHQTHTTCRCLRPVVNAQFRHLPRILDRLRLFVPHEQLCLARPGYSTMFLHHANDRNTDAHPRDSKMVGLSRSAR